MIKVVAFDWGNTVMYDLDEFQHLGAMANWPFVKVVPGIEDALKSLQADYRLVIATNAEMSTAEQVRAALARADLDRYFERIWTALELGVAKPDPAYFEIVLRECACEPGEAVMVGDSLTVDVMGARQAGLHAVWYNAVRATLPGGVPVRPDATIADHAELAGAIRALDGRG